jgi:hypothetical protein
VHALQGDLGFVPREMTVHFEHAVSCGFVKSSGALASNPDILGASIVAIPALRGAYMDALPPHLVHACDLSASLPPHIWNALEKRQLDRSLNLCQFTGLDNLELPQLQVRNEKAAFTVSKEAGGMLPCR